MASYYVAATGSDSNPGTSSQPWATIGHALSSSAAGDVINLNDTDSFSVASTLALSSGRTIQPWHGTGSPTLAGASGVNPIIQATNCAGVILDGLTVTQTGVTNSTATYIGAIDLNSTDGVRYGGTVTGVSIEACDISGGASGITFRGLNTGTGGWNGVTIENNTVHNISEFGIFFQEADGTGAHSGGNHFHYSNVNIQGNTVHDITGDSNTSGASGCGIVLGCADAATGAGAATNYIQGNHVYSCGYAAGSNTAGPAGIFPQYSDSVVTQNNVIHGISATSNGVDGDGLDCDLACSNCTFQYNYTYNNSGPGFNFISALGGNIARFNLSVGDCSNPSVGQNAAVWIQGTGGLQFYHNTVVSWAGGYGLKIADGSPVQANTVGKKIYNNIFSSPWPSPTIYIPATIDGTLAFEGNSYQQGNGLFGCQQGSSSFITSLPTWRSATGLESTGHGVSGTTQFLRPRSMPAVTPSQISTLSQYQLIAGTALVGSAINLTATPYSLSIGSQDLLGNALSSPYSYGAIQPGGAATPWATAVMADVPLAWWRLDEASGAAMTDSALSFPDGSYTGGVTLGQSSLTRSDPDAAASFDGTSGYGALSIPTAPITATNFTAEAWIKPAATTAGLIQIIHGNWGTTNQATAYLLYLDGSDLYLSTANASGAGLTFCNANTTGAGLVAGNTYHVAGIKTGAGTLALYINGVSYTPTYSQTGSFSATSLTAIDVGKIPGGSPFYFGGIVDEAALYLSALSATRVAAHYNAGMSAVLSGSPGSFALSGQAASFSTGSGGFVLTASPGSFSLTGDAATLTEGWHLSAGAGSFSLGGQAASLIEGWHLSASPGAFALSGQAANLTSGGAFVLTASPGAFALSGQAATLTAGGAFTLTASPGAFSLSGQSATLQPGGLTLVASPGVFSLAGQSATLAAGGGLTLSASPGAFVLSGQVATLATNGTGAFTLSASPGVFVLAGGSATWGGSLVSLIPYWQGVEVITTADIYELQNAVEVLP